MTLQLVSQVVVFVTPISGSSTVRGHQVVLLGTQDAWSKLFTLVFSAGKPSWPFSWTWKQLGMLFFLLGLPGMLVSCVMLPGPRSEVCWEMKMIEDVNMRHVWGLELNMSWRHSWIFMILDIHERHVSHGTSHPAVQWLQFILRSFLDLQRVLHGHCTGECRPLSRPNWPTKMLIKVIKVECLEMFGVCWFCWVCCRSIHRWYLQTIPGQLCHYGADEHGGSWTSLDCVLRCDHVVPGPFIPTLPLAQ